MHPYYGFGPPHSLMYFMFFGFFAALISIVVVIPYWFIFKKAGFSPFLALLMLVPLIKSSCCTSWPSRAGMSFLRRRSIQRHRRLPISRGYDLAS